MARLGPLLAAIGAGSQSLQGDRQRKKAEQVALEDRIAKRERDALEVRRLEDLLNTPPEPEPLVVTLDDQGNPVHTPRSQAAGKRAPRPAEPLEVVIGADGGRIYTPRSQAAGRTAPTPAEPLVQVATPDGGSVYKPRSEAVGASAPRPAAPGSAEIQKETNAAKEALALLDEIIADVEANGTDIDPRSTRKAALASRYAQFQLKLKDAAKLGQLTGGDVKIMEDVLNDPTSMTARAKALGREELHRANVLAGAAAARKTLETKLQNLGGGKPESGPADHSALSDEEFAKLWKAGAFKKP